MTRRNLLPDAWSDEIVEAESRRWTPAKIAIWTGIALLGRVAWSMIALVRGETIKAIWFLFAAVATYVIGYRFYSTVVERYLTQPDDRRATPAEYPENGPDYMPTDRRVLYGHHFAAIAGADPLVGHWANHRAFRDAVAAGEASFGNAAAPEAMDAVVR